MAAPAPTVSNPVVVTEAGSPSLTLTADQTSLPYTGGTVNFTATAANLADGTVIHLIENGSDTGLSAPLAAGTCVIPFAVPANSGASPITDTFTAST